MRLIGKRPAEQIPNICRKCFTFLSSHHGGAENDVTMLFADIRGSTTLAEDMSTADFRRLLDRFYTTASGVVFAHDGMVDKFVGDELVANFFPLLTGDRHAIKGVEGVYNRHSYRDEKGDALRKLAALIETILMPASNKKIVRLAR